MPQPIPKKSNHPFIELNPGSKEQLRPDDDPATNTPAKDSVQMKDQKGITAPFGCDDKGKKRSPKKKDKPVVAEAKKQKRGSLIDYLAARYGPPGGTRPAEPATPTPPPTKPKKWKPEKWERGRDKRYGGGEEPPQRSRQFHMDAATAWTHHAGRTRDIQRKKEYLDNAKYHTNKANSVKEEAMTAKQFVVSAKLPNSKTFRRVFETATEARQFYLDKLRGGQKIAMEEILSLMNKAEHVRIDYKILREVYDRGIQAWIADSVFDKTPQQYAFNRVNSFIAGGEAAKIDADLMSEADWAKFYKKSRETENKKKDAEAAKKQKPKPSTLSKIKKYFDR